MKKGNEEPLSEIIIYKADDGRIKLEVRLEHETLWLTQQMMTDLFQTTKQNIGQYLKNIFDEGELDQDSVVKKFFTTAADGKKTRNRLRQYLSSLPHHPVYTFSQGQLLRLARA